MYGDTGLVIFPSVSATSRQIRWYTNGQLNNFESDSIQVRIICSDFHDTRDTISMANADLLVDTKDPSGMALFRTADSTSNTINLSWNPVSTEDHFKHYEIWYGKVLADVEARGGSAVKWDESMDPLLAAKNTGGTEIANLIPATRF
jgi:hypothetical protein